MSAPSASVVPERRSAASRVDWVDVAKGGAIVLVVFFHVGRVLHQADVIGESWLEVNRYAALLRMPLFFALSGVFLGSVLTRTWSRLWQTRLSVLVWAFAVWVVLRFAFFALLPLDSRPSESDLSRLLQAPWQPLNGLWFLHALAVYTVVARATRATPPVAQIVGAAALSWTTFALCATPETYPQRLAAYYFFFVAACHLRQQLCTLVQTASSTTVALAVTTFGVGAWLIVAFGAHTLIFPVGVVAVIAGASVAARLPEATSRPLRWLGTRTLPIYVGHFIAIGAAGEILLALDVSVRGTVHEVWLVPLVVVWSTTSALAAWTLLMRTRLAVLYGPPAWFRRQVQVQVRRLAPSHEQRVSMSSSARTSLTSTARSQADLVRIQRTA